MAEVVVPDADRVRVPERHPGHLGHGPRPDAWDRAEAALQLCVVGPVTDPETMPHPACPTDGVGPTALHSEWVKGPVGQPGQPGRRRRDEETGLARTRCRCAVRPHEPTVTGPGVGTDHLLLEDAGHEGFNGGAGPRHSDPGVPVVQLPHESGPRSAQPRQPALEPGHVVADAEQVAELVEHPDGTLTPGIGRGLRATATEPDVERGRPRRGVGGPPQIGAADSGRVIPSPSGQTTDRRRQIESGQPRSRAPGVPRSQRLRAPRRSRCQSFTVAIDAASSASFSW